ncbi:DMT family transporter [Falsiphaeobacter marinintestinus]|uniref:DMT family transporter n=1 Tax=Falsiphaeobacter marinintestinus TaxID=1492905 RepID=UPI0011B766A7|nr:DMT family transporter [Phaeobacter marinintestinus]
MFEPKVQNPALAAAMIFVATAFIAGSTLFAKTLGTDTFGPPLHPLQVSHGRFVFAFLGFASVALVVRPAFGKIHWRLHLGRTTAGWLGVTLMFASVTFIPMADATALSFMNPVFAMMLAIPLLGETVGRVRWSAAMIAMVGALILLRPTPASFQPAALLALGAALVMGLELIFIKKLSGREPLFQVLLINNLIGVCIASLAVLPVWQAPTLAQWGALAAVGALMACAQVCFVNGMARADASFVAPFSYATLVFAALYDFLVFGARPSWVSVLGAAIILAGALMLALREARLRSSSLR